MMFKIFRRPGLELKRRRRGDIMIWTLGSAASVLLLCGCSMLQPRMPAVDLSGPGWRVRRGQAVWQMPGRAELAGDLLLGLRQEKRAFLEFSKAPFPLATVQLDGPKWEAQFPPHKRYAGRGTPPKRIIWLQLARVLTGHNPPPKWRWRQDSSGWELKNPANGESIRGYFD